MNAPIIILNWLKSYCPIFILDMEPYCEWIIKRGPCLPEEDTGWMDSTIDMNLKEEQGG